MSHFATTTSANNNTAAQGLNKDGKLDVVVQDRGNSAYGTLRVLLGKGGGLFGPVLTVPTKSTDGILVRDVTGDGKVDLATLDTLTNEVLVLPGPGDGMLGAPLRSKVARQPKRIQLRKAAEAPAERAARGLGVGGLPTG